VLASILRVADETDNSWTRALDDYWFPFQLQDRDHLGKAFRTRIEDVEFCHKGHCLILHVPDLEYANQAFELRKDYVKSINKVKGDMALVLSNWGDELKRVGIRFENVFIEYQNQLFKELPVPVPDPQPSTGGQRPTLCEVLDQEATAAVKDMLEASIQLSLGSLGYSHFRWESLEAQVGRPLTDVDRWLAERMADASDGAIVVTDAGEVRVHLKGMTPAAREEMTPAELKEKIGIGGQGR
jgi:hypothetical protein